MGKLVLIIVVIWLIYKILSPLVRPEKHKHPVVWKGKRHD